MFKKKPTASEVDGVQYRRAKLWQIICYACNGLVGMSVYSLIGMASYSASIGYGITTAAVGIILTCSRILDGITDPLLAFVYDRVNTKFGKLRILLVAGYLIEALALYGMFTGFSSKGLGLPVSPPPTPRIWRMPLTLSWTAAGVMFLLLSPAPTAWSISSSPPLPPSSQPALLHCWATPPRCLSPPTLAQARFSG